MGVSSVRRGTAQEDSSGGKVSVLMDGSTQPVELRCILPIKKGQRGTVLYQGGVYVFIALEQLDKDVKNNSSAIKKAEKTLKEAQEDLAELDERLVALDKDLDDLNEDLDREMTRLDGELDDLNTKLYGKDGKSGKMAQLDADLAELDEGLANAKNNLDPNYEGGVVNKVSKAVSTAQKTADGKNKVYVQSNQPSGTFVQGDLWRACDSSGRIVAEKVWDGSSWVTHLLTADTLAVATIVASQAFVDAINASKIITDYLGANKITANEADVSSIVSRDALIDAIGTNKLTANQVDAGSIVTKSVISKTLQSDKLTSNEINVDEIAANEAFLAKLIAQNITAAKLTVAGDNSFAQFKGGTLTLYDSAQAALSTIEASYAKLCQGALEIEARGLSSVISNSLGGPLTISGNNLLATGSWASPRGTATMASNAKMGLTSNEVVIPFKNITGAGMSLYGNGVRSNGISGNVVSGFAMFEGVSGKNCCLALYENSTQIAEAVATSGGDFCMVSIGPIARNMISNATYYLKARTGGGGNIGGGSDAHLKAALTVWT